MEITKRELIISFSIIFVMFIVGIFISGKITDIQNDKNAEYQKAIHIEDTELFKYGMETNVGNAFVYGELKAADPVTYEEIGGEYLHVEKIKERYEKNTRTVTKTDSKGRKHTEIEVYYDWETEERHNKNSERIVFCGIEFPYKKIPYHSYTYIKTINSKKEFSWESGEYVKVRFKYYGTPAKHTGTIYTKLSDDTILDNSRFFKDRTIEESLDECTYEIWNFVFWVFWIILTGFSVYGFCYLENEWLED